MKYHGLFYTIETEMDAAQRISPSLSPKVRRSVSEKHTSVPGYLCRSYHDGRIEGRRCFGRRRHGCKPGYVEDAYLSTRHVAMALERRAENVKLLPSLLAAGWVYIAARVAQGAGGLLPHRFTLARTRGTRGSDAPAPYADAESASAAGPRRWRRFTGRSPAGKYVPTSAVRWRFAFCCTVPHLAVAVG